MRKMKIQIFQSPDEVNLVFAALPSKSKLLFYYKWPGENEAQEIWRKENAERCVMYETALGVIKA